MSNKSLITSYKVVLVGDTGVGKSSIATQFANNEFSEFQESTIGAAFFSKSMEIDGTSYKIDVWDTAGQERYHSLTPMYYRGAKIALIVFDITNLLSYEKMKQWADEIKNSVNNIVITIVGNKVNTNLALNFLIIHNNIITTFNKNLKPLYEFLELFNYKLHFINFHNMQALGGGIRCLTQWINTPNNQDFF